jgi:immunity protein 52 of polymorphic toxin system
MSDAYQIIAYWGPRLETPAGLAPRMLRMLDGLAQIDPLLSGWQWFGGGKKLVSGSELDLAVAEKLLESGLERDKVTKKPLLSLGYYFSIRTRWRQPSELGLQGKLGVGVPTSSYDNDVTLATSYLKQPDEALLQYGIFKPALVLLATLWRANWACAYPVALSDLLPSDKERRTCSLFGGWITYLSPAWAAKITPPKSAIVERAPDGGLLMIATEETFRVDNPRHVAVAREIDAALAPLNALPWPPNDAGDGRAVADR